MMAVSSAVACTWIGEVKFVEPFAVRFGDCREIAVTSPYATNLNAARNIASLTGPSHGWNLAKIERAADKRTSSRAGRCRKC
jgi:hypothetical protein